MAIVQVVMGFAMAFPDMGAGNAIIHRQEITHEQLSILYWLNIFPGASLNLLLLAASPLSAQFNREFVSSLALLKRSR